MLDTARVALAAFYTYRCRQRDRAKRLLDLRELRVKEALEQIQTYDSDRGEDRAYDIQQAADRILDERQARIQEREERIAALLAQKGVTR